MKEEKIKIISEVDELEIDCLLIQPEGKIKGVVQLAHGMNEHKERYIDFDFFFFHICPLFFITNIIVALF